MDAKAKNWITLEFPSEAANVSFARSTVAMFASQVEFTLEDLEDIKVAISEAVSNSVIHGYKDSYGNIVVEAFYDETHFSVSVEDFGSGIADINLAKEAGYTTVPQERMGLGLVFIHEYMDEVVIGSSVGRGTKLVMKKGFQSE